MDNAFKYWGDYLAMTESSYPYKAKDGTCAYNAASGVTNVASYVDVKAKSSSSMVSAVNSGPVSVAI